MAAKITLGCRGASLKVRSDSIEAREFTHFEEKIKRLVTGAGRLLDMSPAPSGRRLISDRAPGSQPDLLRSSSRSPEFPDLLAGPRLQCSRALGPTPPGRGGRRLEARRLSCLFSGLRQIQDFGRRPVPSGGGYLLAARPAVNRRAQRISQTGGMPQALAHRSMERGRILRPCASRERIRARLS